MRIAPRHQGFTLIELLLVIAIIGILSSLIVMSIVTADPAKDLQREAQRLMAVLEMAQDEALFGRQDIGLVVTEHGYSFARYGTPPATQATTEDTELSATDPALGDGKTNPLQGVTPVNPANQPEPEWMAFADENEFRPYELPEDYEIVLEVDDEMVDVTGGKKETDGTRTPSKIAEDDQIRPAIYISPSNEMTPFVMEIYLKDHKDIMVKLSGDETGRLWIGDDEKG